MKVYLVTGCYGSGKTQWIDENLHNASVFSTDNLLDAGSIFADSSKIAKTNAELLCRYNARVADEWFNRNETVVVDAPLCSAIELAPYVALAQAYEHELNVICMRCAPDVAFARTRRVCPIETIEFQVAKLVELIDRYPPWWPLPEYIYTV